MESPEVMRFQTNERQISSLKSGKVGEPEFRHNVRSQLDRLGGVTGVTVVLPSTQQGGEASEAISRVRNLLEENTVCYSVQHFEPAVIFSKEFLVNFVSSGELVILSDQRGPYLEERLCLHNKHLQLSLIKRNHNLSPVEQHFHSKVTTKDGLQHFSISLKDVELKPSELGRLAEAVSGCRLSALVSWSHPDPAVCPSSVARALCEAGMEVTERSCQLHSHSLDSVSVPDGWTEDQVEDVLHWAGGAALQVVLQPPSAPLTAGTVSCVQSSGLHSARTVSQLVSSAYSLLRDDGTQ